MGSKNCPETPRQKMIGMMYLFLTAMLALNVSADILAGFRLVNKSLRESTIIETNKNDALLGQFEDLYNQNKDKVGAWLDKAKLVREHTAELYKHIDELKLEIVRVADGKNADVDNIKNEGNLDAASQVTLGAEKKGEILVKKINEFSKTMQGFVDPDSITMSTIAQTLSTAPEKGLTGEDVPWINSRFQMMPVSAAVAMLTKIQYDIRNIEGLTIEYLKNQVDASDYRVNKIDAVVIPESKYVMQNGKYKARIALVALDTTKVPEIFVAGTKLTSTNGEYERICNALGSQSYEGYILLPQRDGSTMRRPFKIDYMVGPQTVTISADKMNVFYAGIDNEVSISVPGLASANLNASMSNGTITRSGNEWVARPARIGQECIITVTAKMEDGKIQEMGKKPFRVKMLPAPIALIKYTDKGGNAMKYKGNGTSILKADLLTTTGLMAELEDADIDVRFTVLSFDLNIPSPLGISVEPSDGASFTNKQMTYMRGLARNSKFFLSRIKAKGPDGVERTLPPLEVNVN